MAEEKLIAAGGTPEDGGGDGAAADPVSAAVVKSLDTKLESIDDLIARLEIEEGEVHTSTLARHACGRCARRCFSARSVGCRRRVYRRWCCACVRPMTLVVSCAHNQSYG